MVAEVALQKMTVAEFREMEFEDNDPFWYELIDGEVFRKSPDPAFRPAPIHQRVSRTIAFAMHQYVTDNQLGEIFYAPIDVFLDDYNAPQPDIVFVAVAQAYIVTNDGIEGVPALVVEIISPSSIVRDRKAKYEVYEQAGVAEYWLVDPANQEIEVYQWQQERYVLLSAASAIEGTLSSAILPGLVLDLKTLFA
jgi:Uma2 family endonuclease